MKVILFNKTTFRATQRICISHNLSLVCFKFGHVKRVWLVNGKKKMTGRVREFELMTTCHQCTFLPSMLACPAIASPGYWSLLLVCMVAWSPAKTYWLSDFFKVLAVMVTFFLSKVPSEMS